MRQDECGDDGDGRAEHGALRVDSRPQEVDTERGRRELLQFC